MTEYRTGDEPLKEDQKMTDNSKEIIDEIINPKDEESTDNDTPPEPPKDEAQTDREPKTPNALDDIETAVLLVVNSYGNVLPVVQIDNLKMKRMATPREVYRICLDAADQLSSVSVLGEMTQIYSAISKEQAKLTAENMAKLLIAAQQKKDA